MTTALYPWQTGDVIAGTEGMVGRGPIRVGDPGPVPGSRWNGECPFCEEVVYSTLETHDAGLRQHIAIHHPARASEIGVRKSDPEHPGWDIVGDVAIPAGQEQTRKER